MSLLHGQVNKGLFEAHSSPSPPAPLALLDSGSSSHYGVSDPMFWDNVVLSAAYGILFLRSLHVLYQLYTASHRPSSASYRQLPASSAPADRPTSLAVGSRFSLLSGFASYADPADEDSSTAVRATGKGATPPQPAVLRFYLLLAAFSAARCTIWGLSAHFELVEDEKLQLAIVTVPSLVYLSILFVLVHAWWQTFDALVETTQSTHALVESNATIHGKLRGPFTALVVIIWLGAVGLYMYLALSGRLNDKNDSAANAELWYTGVLFLVVGGMFMFIGIGIFRRLSSIPYSLPGMVALRRKIAFVTAIVGPACIVRAVITVLQLSSSHGIKSIVSQTYFPTLFYVLFEIFPLLVVVSTLRPTTDDPAAEDCEYANRGGGNGGLTLGRPEYYPRFASAEDTPPAQAAAPTPGRSPTPTSITPTGDGPRQTISPRERTLKSGYRSDAASVAPLGLRVVGKRQLLCTQSTPIPGARSRATVTFEGPRSPTSGSGSGINEEDEPRNTSGTQEYQGELY